jgi:dipeptidyl aminopeptidase/acylaminoacyl peptidase
MAVRKVKIEDLRRFVFVSDPQISPDGRRVAFVHTKIDYPEDRYLKHIWMWDRESGKAEQFTYGPGSDSYPRWSPDGRWLLFLSRDREPEKKTQIWVIPRSGGESRLAADMEEGVSNPSWAPDSKRLLFLSCVWMEGKIKSDVKVVRRIKYKLNGVGTFEGRRVHLFTARTGRKPRQVTEGGFDVEAAKWSPDGTSIAFIANMEEDADLSRVKDIYLVPSKGEEPRRLTHGGHLITDLSWSPKGECIAFIGNDEPDEPAANLDLWLMSLEGGGMRNLTEGFDRTLDKRVGSDLRVATPNPGAVWSHNGSIIYFVTASIPHSNIYRVDVDEGDVEAVNSGKTIDGFGLSADGSVMAFNAMDATHPMELWIRDDKGERRLTDFNGRLLKRLNLSKPEPFTFKNPLGEEVDGWIMKPPDHEEGDRCPAVLEIHGGPRSVYGDAIFHEFQVLAAEGYVVLYTNPRGSSGYGEDYAKVLMSHYGEMDYDDLMAFVDEALKRFPFIDPDRLGVAGGSYGGYMTNWIVSHTDRFRAAVTFRSICNWVSKFGCSDIGYTQPESIAGDPDYWEQIEKHIEKSPIKYAKNVKTPTLIVHSEDDLRCPLEQAEQWFVALKQQGVPTELVRFPDENHELSRSGKPKHREERLKHMLRWLNNYLK